MARLKICLLCMGIICIFMVRPAHADVSVADCVSYEENVSVCHPEKQTYLVQAAIGRLILDLIPMPEKEFNDLASHPELVTESGSLSFGFSENSTYSSSSGSENFAGSVYDFFYGQWKYLSGKFMKFYRSVATVKEFVSTHGYNESAQFIFLLLEQKIEDFSLLIYNAMESGMELIQRFPFYEWQPALNPGLIIDELESQLAQKKLVPVILGLADQWYLQDQMTLESSIFSFMETYVRISGRPATLNSFEESLFFAFLSSAADRPVLLFFHKDDGLARVLQIQSGSEGMTLRVLDSRSPVEIVDMTAQDLRFVLRSGSWGLVNANDASLFRTDGAAGNDFYQSSEIIRTFKYPFKSEKAKCNDDLCRKVSAALKVLHEKEKSELKERVRKELKNILPMGSFSGDEDEDQVKALMVLGLGSSFSREELKKTYKYYSVLLHPDKVKNYGLSAEELKASRVAQGMINESFKILSKMLKEDVE